MAMFQSVSPDNGTGLCIYATAAAVTPSRMLSSDRHHNAPAFLRLSLSANTRTNASHMSRQFNFSDGVPIHGVTVVRQASYL